MSTMVFEVTASGCAAKMALKMYHFFKSPNCGNRLFLWCKYSLFGQLQGASGNAVYAELECASEYKPAAAHSLMISVYT